jgi:ribonucleoside-diphosphate reductase alpha chain
MSEMFGINQSVAVTAVKPSGNSSQLVDASSGIHPRWSKYYIRRVRINSTSPIYKVLRDAGVPMSPENGQTEENATTWVASFPVKSPEDAVVKDDVSVGEMLFHIMSVNNNYAEHNVSATIAYSEDDWISIVHWAHAHQKALTGVSFIPESNARYDQMPYEEITEQRYNELAATFPKIDWSKIYLYEKEDMTEAAQEVACVAGVCEVEFNPELEMDMVIGLS